MRWWAFCVAGVSLTHHITGCLPNPISRYSYTWDWLVSDLLNKHRKHRHHPGVERAVAPERITAVAYLPKVPTGGWPTFGLALEYLPAHLPQCVSFAPLH